jgi:hypothetical protein
VWIGVAVIAVAGTIALIAVFWPRHSPPPRPPTASSTTESPTPTPRVLRQARWHTNVFAAAIIGKVTKKDRKAARTQGLRASRGIEHVYDKLLLDPSAAPQVIHSHFKAAAARSFLHADIQLPRTLTRVQITHRAVQIGVNARTARNAIATVRVLLKGVQNSKRIKLQHEATLWLERVHWAWKVLAFRARQVPR